MSHAGEKLRRGTLQQHVDIALCLVECAHQIIGAIEVLVGPLPAEEGAGRGRILELDALVGLIGFGGGDRRALEGSREGFGVEGLVRVGA